METGVSSYNEALTGSGAVREPYGPLMEVMDRLGSGMLAERRARADEKLRELGATFPLPSDDPGLEDRILPADWMPRILPRDHWTRLSAGLLQRGRALNAWLTDLHNGEGGVVPEEIVESSAFTNRLRPLPETSAPHPIHIYGPDVVHLGDGEYVVLEDNVRVPSGVAYSEAIRRAGLAVMPEMFDAYEVSAIHEYYEMLRQTLELAAPADADDEPNVAIITGGSDDPAYFEHARIARECRISLLTLEECRIGEGGEVRTKADGRRIDAIYRRVDGGYVVADLPELEDAYRADKVGLANALGVGVADDKAVFPYVPEMIRTYLDEEPLLPGAPTFSLADPEARAEALERLPEMVLKPREGYGAKGVLIGPEASRGEIEGARRQVNEDPTGYIAQECLDFSTHALDASSEGSAEAFVDLRAFVLPAVGYVMPGGLTRVAQAGTRVVNSSAGGSFKDTWVLEE